MSATKARVKVSAVGNDLIAARITDCGRRASNFFRRLQAPGAKPLEWDDLSELPVWLRSSRAELQQLAQRIALLSMAQSLTQSIDGGWLGALAEQAGDQQLEWAIARADTAPILDLPRVDALQLEPRGYALLAASLPPRLRDLLPASGDDVSACSPDQIASLLAEATR